MWVRYNSVSRYWEYSTNNGASFSQLPIDASILTHGSVPDARLSGNVMMKNSNNIITANNPLQLENNSPIIDFKENDAPLNTKRWRFVIDAQLFFLQTVDDAYASILNNPLTINRAGDLVVLRDVWTGRGIQFPATQVPSTDVNCLDDYEEGSWTPVFGGSTSESGQTYSSRNGRYIKIGQNVWVSCEILVSNLGAIVGNMQIKNLPFQVGPNTADRGWFKGYWANTASAFVWLTAVCEASSTVATMYGATAATTGLGGLGAASFTNTTILVMDATYKAAA